MKEYIIKLPPTLSSRSGKWITVSGAPRFFTIEEATKWADWNYGGKAGYVIEEIETIYSPLV